jgi:hypothetical protein
MAGGGGALHQRQVAGMSGRPFTESEREFVRRHAPQHTDAAIGEALGRTAESISYARRKLHVYRVSPARIAALEAAVLALLERVEQLECGRMERAA